MARLKRFNLHSKNKWFGIMVITLGLFILCGIIYSSTYALYKIEKKYDLIGSLIGSFTYEYTLNYNTNGGSVCNSKTITYNESLGTLCAPTKTGYEFLGWFDGNEEITDETVLDTRNDINAVARWSTNCNYNVNQTWTIGYTGSESEFIFPCNGEYEIELWGAEGGASSLSNGGKGAYASGIINLLKDETLYFNVGGKGKNGGTTSNFTPVSAYNGGGGGSDTSQTLPVNNSPYVSAGGGGATDVRTVKKSTATRQKYRYIRDYANGSNTNNLNHWQEIQVFDVNGDLISDTATVSSSNTPAANFGIGNVNDNTMSYCSINANSNLAWVELDLGAEYEIGYIRIWHYYDGRIYNNTKTVLYNGTRSVTYTAYDSAVSGTYQEPRTGKIYYIESPSGINSRIMVAAGGGGGGYSSTAGYGGALIGADSGNSGGSVGSTYGSRGATQIAPGAPIAGTTSGSGTSYMGFYGSFAYGAGGTTAIHPSGGGGGGYYGGTGGSAGDAGVGGSSGSGGSSYISGYLGAVAITSATNQSPRTGNNGDICSMENATQNALCSYHYSNKFFDNTEMIAGNSSMPNWNGNNTIVGNTGNGYAKITLSKVYDDYILTYNNNGGTGCSYKEIIYNQTYGTLCTPIKTNATFVKWIDSSGNTVTSNTVLNSMSNKTITAIYSEHFKYTGSYQAYTVPISGTYQVELWGASGFASTGTKGKGAYTSGQLNMTAGETYYIYVGEGNTNTANGLSFNGGRGDNGGWPGGGATDIRLSSGAWNNDASIKTRIMVAGAGGTTSSGVAGSGGALYGLDGSGTEGATQLAVSPKQSSGYGDARFGVSNGGCSGGNGYYPAGGATCASGSGGGSSFISGHKGAVAITSNNSLTPRNNSLGSPCTESNAIHDVKCSYHYSNKVFTNTQMIAGIGNMPNYNNTATMLGNDGHGHAKITFIGPTVNITLNTDGGSGCSSTHVVVGQKVGELCQPIKTGYSFNTWRDLNGNIITKDTVYSASMGTTFTARYGTCAYSVGKTWTYATTGNTQTLTIPCDGTYKLEVYGAQGGSNYGTGGLGGYSYGNYRAIKGNSLYIYVGGQPTTITNGGYNGGSVGVGVYDSVSLFGYSSGGGATDIRSVPVDYDANDSLHYRIIVAGGGGGGAFYGTGVPGGTGGGLVGGNIYYAQYSYATTYNTSTNHGADQTYSGAANTDTYELEIGVRQGTKGTGAWYAGGGGYYGGAFYAASNRIYGGAGGSGYIGGVLNGSSSAGQRSGNGYVRITLQSIN